MSLFPRFANPEYLPLLLAVPWAVYAGVRMRSLSPMRKWTAVTLRAVILTAVILALAGAEMVRRHDRLAVYFLLDRSNSIPETQRRAAVDEVRAICETHMGRRDEAGVIAFGARASVELMPAPAPGLREIQSFVGGDETDIAGAIRLAAAAFPQGYMRRIVVITDGNETRGAALEEAKAARAHGIAVDVIPIQTGGLHEVRVREVAAPHRAGAGEPVQVRIVVHASHACSGTLFVALRAGIGAAATRRMLDPQAVDLQPGDNVFLLNQPLSAPGVYEYEARIESESDSIAENNTGRAFTTVLGEPEVLLAEGAPGEGAALEEALVGAGLRVTRTDPFAMPQSPSQFQHFAGIVLANVSSMQMSSGQLSIVNALVRDQGVGLVMVGGPASFGAGGYEGTPVEEALPVSMDIKQRKVVPSCALVLVIDKSGSMEGAKVLMAKRAAVAAVGLLSTRDYIGVVGFDGEPRWVVDVQHAADKDRIIHAIGTLGAGGGTDMYPALVQAYDALSRTPANLRHCIVLSDGHSHPGDFEGIVRQMAAEKITVSAVALGYDADQQLLPAIAHWGGGRYYFTGNPGDIPQFFTKEAQIIRRNMLIEEEFTPAPWHESELLAGLEAGTPPLHGYVVTTPKDTATVPLVSHEGDPVLAHWRYGLGKSVAFTSGAAARWGADWLAWEGFGPFWAQTVRWVLRPAASEDFRVETRLEDGMGRIRVDAVDSTGRFVNFLEARGVVSTPDGERIELEFEQTGPGIYEAAFPVPEKGVYLANITYADQAGRTAMVPTGLAVDYPREYEYHTTNTQWLASLAALGGGRVLGAGDSPFAHDLAASPVVTPVWRHLAMLAACLLPLEIFVRRVVIPLAAAWAWLASALRRIAVLRRLIPEPQARPIPVTGVYRAAAPAAAQESGAAPDAASYGEVAPPSEPPRAGLPPDKAPARGKSAYTSRLLDAKDRARARWTRNEEQRDDDKENRP